MSVTTPKMRYNNHKATSKRRGIEFNLTFEQWWDIWEQSGKWEVRGVGADKYCMARYGDQGNYEIGNVYITTFSNNSKDANTGRIHTSEMREKCGAVWRGKKQSPEHIKKRFARKEETV